MPPPDPPPGFRLEPSPSATTASPAPTGAQFRTVDRQAGWLVVNRWTYRLLRPLFRLLTPHGDLTGVQVTEERGAARGLQIVRPDAAEGSGAVLLIHGGGFVVGSNTEAVWRAVRLARGCGVPVVCPAYRLAPEHPFPAALDDCHASWRWLVEHASELGIDPAKIVLAGISAGGGHAAALAQRLHDEGGPQPAGQLLIYPMLDDRTAARRELDRPRHRVWSNRNNRFGWTSHLGHPPGAPSAADYAVPARREDLSGLPPAWIGIGSSDLFLDEDRAYAQRLQAAGVDVTYVEIEGGIHGFDEARDAPLTEAFFDAAIAFTRGLTD